MLDTFAIAERLASVGLSRDQAAVITNAVQQAAQHGDAPSQADLRAAVSHLETRITEVEVRLVKWMIGTVLGGVGITVAILRLLSR